MYIILIGPPGSGKGTQGRLIAQKMGLSHFSSGDFFRKIAKNIESQGVVFFGDVSENLRLARKDEESIEFYMSKGALLPSDLVNKIMKIELSSKEYKVGCILDGYPRNLQQAEFLEGFLKEKKKIISFEVEDELIFKRILGRFSCSVCHKIYNSYYAKTSVENVCDACGSTSFTRRTDDDLEIIKERIAEYRSETYPIIEFYKKIGEFYSVDANVGVREITLKLEDLLKIS